MEEKIEKMYCDCKRIVKKALVGLSIGVIVLMLIVSIFLGPPFPYKEEILFFSFWQKGWFFEKKYVIFLIYAIVFIPTFIWELYEMLKGLNVFRDMLYRECDALALLKVAKLGIDYVPEKVYRRRNKAIRMQKKMRIHFERFYVEALNACGFSSEALKYLEKKWKSKRNSRLYKFLLQNTRLILAYTEEDMEKYMEIYEQAVPAIRKSPLIKAQKKCMEKQYMDAIGLLKDMKYHYLYEKVSAEYIIGCCYYKLGEYSEAAEHLMFVIESGNTRIVKEKAIELCQRIV